jgi:N-acetylmuramoyl-L-alanine amidase
MKLINITFLSLIFLALLTANGQESVRLEIIYPKNNMTINAPSTFFVGNTDPKATLKINGANVKIFPNGGFTQVVKLKRGTNTINIKTSLKKTEKKLIYTINVPEYEKSVSQSGLNIDLASIRPDSNLLIRAGDEIVVSFKGTPKQKASFSIGNIKDIPMIETEKAFTQTDPIFGKSFNTSKEPINGIYKGTYIVQDTDNFKNIPIIIKLSCDKKNITRITNSKITSIDKSSIPIIAEVKKDNATTRTAPNKSRLTPLLKGTKIHITGKNSNFYRFEMGSAMEGWISTADVKLLTEGTAIPKSGITAINIESKTDEALIKIPLTEKIPFLIQELPDSTLIFTLYGAIASLDLFKYDQNDDFIKEIKWFQPYKDTVQIYITQNSKQLWGYEYYYEGDIMILKIRKPPVIDSINPLKDKIIVIDAGHGDKESGSIGPTGVPEKTVNLSISYYLKNILEKKGATVFLTRTTNDFNPDLSQRTDYANFKNAHILLSIHNNALPDGADPYQENGASTYYYNSQALPLARSVQDSLVNNLGMNNYGLFWDSLAMTRPTKPLAILIEVGFMINPAEYMMLIDPEFQKKAADSISSGVENFFIKANSEKN